MQTLMGILLAMLAWRLSCSRGAPTDVLNNTDCDDADVGEYPGVIWYTDADGDSYGSTLSGSCSRVVSSDVLNNVDCDDSSAFLNPADTDGDGLSTCSGDCDDTDANLNQEDNDGDGYSTCDGDCNDASSSESPAGIDDCSDGLDNDCNGVVDDGSLGDAPQCALADCSEVSGTGYYYVDFGSGADLYYCENDTDGGGWTLAYWVSYSHHMSSGAVNRTSLGNQTTHAKLSDTEIASIASSGASEVMVKDHHSSTIYIERFAVSAWSSFSSSGWTNQPYESRVPQERGWLVAMVTGTIGVFQPGRTMDITPVQQPIKAPLNTLPPIIPPNTLMVLVVNMGFMFDR